MKLKKTIAIALLCAMTAAALPLTAHAEAVDAPTGGGEARQAAAQAARRPSSLARRGLRPAISSITVCGKEKKSSGGCWTPRRRAWAPTGCFCCQNIY